MIRRVDLLGRQPQQVELAQLLNGAREGRSGVLVIRGEPGIGKTELLEDFLARATGLRIAHVSGAESEMELAYAGLHQLCAPLLKRVDRLPDPQRKALQVALGLSEGDPPDRFLVGLAVLTLMGEAAAERPLICVVDDAQWVDRASLQALAFVARRQLADPVVVVFAMRESALDEDLAGLPQLALRGLEDREAHSLLAATIPGRLDEHVQANILAEAHGNPLALLELHRVLSPAELAGGFGLAQSKPLLQRIERDFVERLRGLPTPTRTLLLIVASEPAGDAAWSWAAANRLDIGVEAAAPAEATGLVTVGNRIRFRHPLVRSAIYHNASLSERRQAHRALAEVIDGPGPTAAEHRAWHSAHAAERPDEQVARDLECSGNRARARGGVAAAAAFLTHATALTPDPTRRAERALSAAQAKLDAGAPGAASELLTIARDVAEDELTCARIDLLRAKVALAANRGSDAPPLLLAAAERLTELDPLLARETHFEAMTAAIYAGRLAGAAGSGVLEAAHAARKAPPAPNPPRAIDLLLDGLAVRFTDGYTAAAPLCTHALREFRREDAEGKADLRWYQVAGRVALDLFDHETFDLLAVRQLELLKTAGFLPWLPLALDYRAAACVMNGDFEEAGVLLDQADVVAGAIGVAAPHYVQPYLAAHRGQEQLNREVAQAAKDSATERGEGRAITMAHYATAILYNGLGQYQAALASAKSALEHDDIGAHSHVLVEMVEAGARCGDLEAATDAMRTLVDRAEASKAPAALGVAARSRALLADGTDAEREYGTALGHLEHSGMVVYLARTHLVYGEWLRRMNRLLDARGQLHQAHEMFTRMGAEGFAERTRRELLGTGEAVRKAPGAVTAVLTTQESYISRLARAGHTNSEIAAQLFISPRTVEWHLSKIFSKLGISSRRELRNKTTDAP
jgi:DNA-binding CsgD family transcriptional regulator/tetratricopeptide (TPR) repeat protein